MTIEMTQLRLNCPYCGNYLWTAKRTVYNMNTKAWELAESTAYCEKCEKSKHLEVLKNADKIVPLKEEQRKT
jgi:RNase P subunit RPR2